jgi:hypothetical protein
LFLSLIFEEYDKYINHAVFSIAPMETASFFAVHAAERRELQKRYSG